ELARSMNLRIQFIRIEALHLRARCGLTAAAETGDRRMLTAVMRDAARIHREHTPWSVPIAESLRAGVCAMRGEIENSRTMYERAAQGFEKAEMSLFAAVARRRL